VVTVSIEEAESSQKGTEDHPGWTKWGLESGSGKVSEKEKMQPINRVKPRKPLMTVDEAVAADRNYFDEHPDEMEYIREFVPGNSARSN
jgi:hypothetical protein